LLNKFKSTSGFKKSLITLVFGTAGSQAIVLMLLPLLTRLYTPEEFGSFSVFASLLGIFSVVAALRYEVAIPLPLRNNIAFDLVIISLFSILSITLFITITLFLFGDYFLSALANPLLEHVFYLLPVGIGLTGIYSVLLFWATRRKAFKSIALSRVQQSLAGGGTQTVLGIFGFGVTGLVIGQIVNNCGGLITLLRGSIPKNSKFFSEIELKSILNTSREYKNFPKYSTFEALTNSASVNVPIILLGSLVLGPELGALMLAMRVMQTPMGLIGGAISQVYFSEAAEKYEKNELKNFTVKVLTGLCKAGVGPLIFASITAPYFFGVVFGSKWGGAGEILQWMTPWFIMQFLVSPVSMAFHVTGNQRMIMNLQILGLVLRVSIVLFSNFLFDGKYILEAFSLSGALFYLIYFYFLCRIINIDIKGVAIIFRKASPFLLSWIVCAFLVIELLSLLTN
jgi:O-antigen/teichoic acid export membrane protein